MSNLVPIDKPTRISRDTLPRIGDYYWVTQDDWDEVTCWTNGRATAGKGKKTKEVLMCVAKLASNHVEFHCASVGGGYSHERVRYRDLFALTRLEPNWKDVIQQKIDQKQLEMKTALIAMADVLSVADLLPSETAATETMLPSTVRRDPKEAKAALIKLKKTTFPAAQAKVDHIVKEMVSLQRGLFLPMLIAGKRMELQVDTVESRLFVLELYAGIGEDAKEICQGEPASTETPITIRQMMRYMDEECLIDYDKGGMNYAKLADFDKWVAKPENFKRLCPEERCVVALKIRRKDKNYGRCYCLEDAFAIIRQQEWDKATYLLLRNGEQVWRLATEIDFDPRILPLRKEFDQPLVKKGWYNHDKGDYDYEEITPDSLDYDEVMNERKQTLFKHNRILFLIQGLLDRSKVFSPHPPIDLSNGAHVQEHTRLVFDEEVGLPSANPPVWEKYRDDANQSIKVGTVVWCGAGQPLSNRVDWRTREGRVYYKLKYPWGNDRPLFCEVGSISRDRKFVTLRWCLGNKTKEERVLDMTRPADRPGYYFTKALVHDLGVKYGTQKVAIERVFNPEGYWPGDYKKFLCDAYLKGAYLQWAPALLACEDYHRGVDGIMSKRASGSEHENDPEDD